MTATLVLAAHPDDEVLGCGATIARLARAGIPVDIAILGEGITSRYERREQADPQLVSDLRDRSQRAGRLLGAREVILHDLPDNRFDTVALLDIVKLVEGIIARCKPTVIYTHHGGDLNTDHAIVHRAVLTATRPVADQSVRDIYAFEVPSATDWAFQRFAPPFRPNVFVDVTDTLEVKVQALGEYDTEIRAFPHPRSPEAVRAVAQRWGSVSGCLAIEAFELIRSVRPRET